MMVLFIPIFFFLTVKKKDTSSKVVKVNVLLEVVNSLKKISEVQTGT